VSKASGCCGVLVKILIMRDYSPVNRIAGYFPSCRISLFFS
jgi:hypothetical protein